MAMGIINTYACLNPLSNQGHSIRETSDEEILFAEDCVLIPLVIRVIQSKLNKFFIGELNMGCLNPLSNQGHSIVKI